MASRAGGGAVHNINTGHVASVRYCLVLFGGGSGGSQAESSGPEASASIRAAITKSDSCNPPIFRVVNDTSQKPIPTRAPGDARLPLQGRLPRWRTPRRCDSREIGSDA